MKEECFYNVFRKSLANNNKVAVSILNKCLLRHNKIIIRQTADGDGRPFIVITEGL